MGCKKAQVTIFIILAVVLLIGAGIFFLFVNNAQDGIFNTQQIKQENIPSTFEPVKQFITECVQDVSREALVKIGQTGGYVSLDDPELNGNLAVGEAFVPFSPDGSDRTVYWRFYDGANFQTKQPPLHEEGPQKAKSIESQISRYVEAKLNDCTSEFDTLTQQGFTFQQTGKRKAKTIISDEDVQVQLSYPLKVTKANADVDMSQFFARIPIKMKQIYELANEITQVENEFTPFEHYTNTMLYITSGENPSPPPKYEFDLTFAPKIWSRTQVANNIKSRLDQHIQTFKAVKENTTQVQSYPDSLHIPITGAASTHLDELNVRFKTATNIWPFSFDMCGKEVCRSASCSGLADFFPCQQTRTSYQIEYPIMVEVTQPGAFTDQDYNFRFFLQHVIKNNAPVTPDYQHLSPISFSSKSTQLCDTKAWDSGEITIAALNKQTNEPIQDARIHFTSARESCFVGSTDESGALKTTLPTGTLLGSLSVEKENHIGITTTYDATSQDDVLEIQLAPIVPINYTIKKRLFEKRGGWNLKSQVLDLEPDEQVIITLERVAAPNEEPYSTFASIPPPLLEDSVEINLAPGTYNADMQLISNDIVIIPKDRDCFYKPLFSRECVEIPEIRLGSEASNTLHVAKLTDLTQGTHSFQISCFDQSTYDQSSPQNPPDIITETLSITTTPQTNEFITSKTFDSFITKEVLFGVETQTDATCKFKQLKAGETPDADINPQNYDSFQTAGTLHLEKMSLGDGEYSYDIICKPTDDSQDWTRIAQPITFAVQASFNQQTVPPQDPSADPDWHATPDPNPTQPLDVFPIEINTFSGSQAYIAFETSHKTSCTYANVNDPTDANAKPMGIGADGQFLAGGFKGQITVPDLKDAKDITFYVLDMGLDDTHPSKLIIDDVDHLNNVDQKSEEYKSRLKPTVRLI